LQRLLLFLRTALFLPNALLMLSFLAIGCFRICSLFLLFYYLLIYLRQVVCRNLYSICSLLVFLLLLPILCSLCALLCRCWFILLLSCLSARCFWICVRP